MTPAPWLDLFPEVAMLIVSNSDTAIMAEQYHVMKQDEYTLRSKRGVREDIPYNNSRIEKIAQGGRPAMACVCTIR